MSKNKYNTLLSNTLLISMGTFGSKILVFLMVRFYTGYLTPSDYSTADLITQTANLLFPIISVGIADGVFRFVMDKESDKKSVLTLGFWCITFGALAFLGIIPLLGLVDDFKGYIWLIVVYTLASCYHSLCVSYLRGVGKTALFALQGILNTALVIVLNIIFLAFFSMGITGYVLSVVLADVLSTLFLNLKEKLWREFTFKPDFAILKPMLKYSIPLIPTTVFWWITSVSDRYMVNEIISSDANGLYAIAYKLPTLLTLVSTMFMQAWQYSAVVEDEGDREEHAKFFGTVWGSFQSVMFLAGAGVIAIIKPIMKSAGERIINDGAETASLPPERSLASGAEKQSSKIPETIPNTDTAAKVDFTSDAALFSSLPATRLESAIGIPVTQIARNTL